MEHETIATFPLRDKSQANAVRDQLLREGRKAWLHLNNEPELTVSVRAERLAQERRRSVRR
jgi:hypothetical protein